MLEEIIYSNKNEFEIIKDLRKEIKKYRENINDEASGKQFFIKYTKKMDEFITIVFKFVLQKKFGFYRPNINSLPIVLTALGSYGREQLSLYSDIDIMIVYKDIEGYNLISVIETFVTMLWDLGLEIGHRVHKIDELLEVSKTDLTIKTAILESRYIFGSRYLWVEVENELKKIRFDNQKEFVIARYKKIQEYHKKYPLSMEPNIKQGFGGMRDANTFYWIANVIYGVKNNSELIAILFSEEEYKEYRNALEFIFRVRTHLHIITKSHKDVVLLDYQRDIALKLGYQDSPRLKAERIFVRELLKSLWIINRFTSINIKKILKPFLFNPKTITKINRIARGYYICDNKIYVNWHNRDSMKDSFRVFLENDFKTYDASLVNLFYHQKVNITNKQIKKMFKKENLYPIIKALYKADKLSMIIPAFKQVENLAQFDGYHQYPVDIHSIKTLYNLENIRYQNIKELFDNLNEKNRQILKIVALFHDLGKGRKEDHHLVGAKLVAEFMQNLKFKNEEIEIAKKLIKYHTTMSNISQREDIDNDRILLNFANIVQTKEFLKMLYILTYADMDAVGNIFNDFKANLLKTFYNNTLEVLENRELILASNKRQRKEKQLLKNDEFLALPRLWQNKVLNSPSIQMFLRNDEDKIVDISKKMLECENYNYSIHNTHPLSIEIVKKDIDLNLGYLLAKFSHLSLGHIAIYKIDNVKYFKIEYEENIDEDDKFLIYEIIENSFKTDKEIKFVKPILQKEEFSVDCNHSKNYIALKLKTKNKNGIIAFIMKILDKYKIDVEDVKISVQKDVVRDIFIINKSSRFCEKIDIILGEFK
jgi:[protein-PII] uridylyltransferase